MSRLTALVATTAIACTGQAGAIIQPAAGGPAPATAGGAAMRCSPWRSPPGERALLRRFREGRR
jgi:hypothetical protein